MLFKMVKSPIYIKYVKSRKYVLFSRLGVNALKTQKNNEDVKWSKDVPFLSIIPEITTM